MKEMKERNVDEIDGIGEKTKELIEKRYGITTVHGLVENLDEIRQASVEKRNNARVVWNEIGPRGRRQLLDFIDDAEKKYEHEIREEELPAVDFDLDPYYCTDYCRELLDFFAAAEKVEMSANDETIPEKWEIRQISAGKQNYKRQDEHNNFIVLFGAVISSAKMKLIYDEDDYRFIIDVETGGEWEQKVIEGKSDYDLKKLA